MAESSTIPTLQHCTAMAVRCSCAHDPDLQTAPAVEGQLQVAVEGQLQVAVAVAPAVEGQLQQVALAVASAGEEMLQAEEHLEAVVAEAVEEPRDLLLVEGPRDRRRMVRAAVGHWEALEVEEGRGLLAVEEAQHLLVQI